MYHRDKKVVGVFVRFRAPLLGKFWMLLAQGLASSFFSTEGTISMQEVPPLLGI
jgi:hypothetical protein